MKFTNQSPVPNTWVHTMPLAVALLLVLGGGIFLLDKADKQTRDTTRKHHLEDIENSIYFARNEHGTFPPYNKPTWCGLLHASENEAVREQIELALRKQNEEYANKAKPFPTDPLYKEKGYDYFYWKRSPVMFELYAVLESDKNGERDSLACDNAPDIYYDYGINSALRQNSKSISI